MRINKKFIVFIAILLVIIIPVYKVQAAKLKCNEITDVNFCPAPGIDGYGNACKKEYVGTELECVINHEARTCSEIYKEDHVCNSVDDYGNVCAQKYDGTCYIKTKSEYKELKRCEEYTYQEGCPTSTGDYLGNTCAKDSTGQCYTVKSNVSCESITKGSICKSRTDDCVWLQVNEYVHTGEYRCYSKLNKTNDPTCASIGSDRLTCQRRADDCTWIKLDGSKSYCDSILTPSSNSTECSKITDYATCKRRDDCEYGKANKQGNKCQSILPNSSEPCDGIKDSDICDKRDDCTMNKSSCVNIEERDKLINDFVNIVNGTEINLEDVEFKCSDVKYLTGAWLLIRIAAPFIIILLGSLDFFKSVIAGDEKEMKKSRGKFIKRLIAFILLIILPFIVQFIFSTMGTYGSDNVCLLKCIATNDTSSKGCD